MWGWVIPVSNQPPGLGFSEKGILGDKWENLVSNWNICYDVRMKMLSHSSAERRYDRIAWLFDSLEFPMEKMAAKKWRKNYSLNWKARKS